MLTDTTDEHISFRPLSIFDAGAFTRLKKIIECDAPHLALGRGERRETFIHTLMRMLITRNRTRTLIAHSGKELIGYATVILAKFRKLRGNAYLTIAIHDRHRGKGIGTKLISIAENYAKERGARRMELEVFAKNTKAIKLYRYLGYEQEGVKRQAVQDHDGFDDIVFMAKFL